MAKVVPADLQIDILQGGLAVMSTVDKGQIGKGDIPVSSGGCTSFRSYISSFWRIS